ncbi:SDR family oxidoreductase [Undibacterium sp. TJN25]|uniref:SDR family oxidoreductase n=1 Tax=Undibacterium sp. TJN25 TaxID=3413056 RepID=UPI003BF230BE
MKNGVVIVTGASRGIGQATAIRLANDFAKIVLVARSGDLLEETAASISSAGSETLTIECDLRKPDVAEMIVKRTLAQFGSINSVVNIAGAVPQIDLFEMTDEQWEDGEALKLHGARRLTLKAWEALKASKGSVIFTSGNSALTPKSGFAAVATVNAAIVALAKAFADRGISDGIQVNSVLPGPVMTDRRRGYLEKYAITKGMTISDAIEHFPVQAGISRYGNPEEIANLIGFILSPAARWMTGTALRIDGGEIKSV